MFFSISLSLFFLSLSLPLSLCFFLSLFAILSPSISLYRERYIALSITLFFNSPFSPPFSLWNLWIRSDTTPTTRAQIHLFQRQIFFHLKNFHSFFLRPNQFILDGFFSFCFESPKKKWKEKATGIIMLECN